MKNRFKKSIAVVFFGSFASSALAADAMPKVAAPLFDAIAGLTSATGKSLETSRSSARVAALRADLYKVMAGGAVTVSSTPFLCSPRGDYAALLAQRGYLLQISGVLKSTSTVEITGLMAALSSFFQDIKISPPAKVAPSDIKSKAIAACAADVKSALKTYFLSDSLSKTGIIDEAISLVQLISGIIQTAVADTAQLVSQQRRQDVIRTFLKGEAGLQTEKTAQSLLAQLKAQLATDRQNAAAEYLSAIQNFKLVADKVAGLAKDGACKDTIKDAGAAPPIEPINNSSLWPCWRSIWDADVQAAAKDLLAAAAVYDAAADLGLAAENGATAVIAKAMTDIRTGADEGNLDQFLAVANQLLGIAKDYEAVFSKDNRDKIKASVGTLVSALKE
jgi:hypothetical protein